MPTDIAQLGIKIEATDIKAAVRELNKLEKQSERNERTNKSLTDSFGGLRTIVAAFAGSLAVKKFLDTAGAFESMSVSLETVTGSAEKATMAMDGILEFAKNTPFSVRELTDSFIKLKALGIEPTESSLTSFGNTSSAMGKSLNQMIEAVADASTGEFERLKEFGIKARSQGDDVTFTFQGVATTVRKNSEEITGYLESIGKTQFAGAMSKQMDTLNGKLSNLGDTVDAFFVTIATAGGGAGGKALIDALANSIKWLTKFVHEGILEFTDLGSALGAYAAIAAKVLSLDFAGASAIIEMRKKQRIEVDKTIAGIWKEKTAQDSLNASKGIDVAGAGAAKGAVGKSFAGARDLEKLQAKYGDELRLLAEKQNSELMLIEEALNERAISEQRAEELRLNLTQQYADKRVVIAKNKAKQEQEIEKAKNAALSGIFSNLSTLMNSKSRKLFKLGKAAAISSALINTYQAVTKTMASVPYPFNIGLAVAQGAAGMVQVQNIKAQQFGGGGSASVSGGGGGGGSLPAQTPEPLYQTPDIFNQDANGANARELRIVVESDGVHSDGMRKFAQDLAETIEDMGGLSRLVVS